MHCLPFSKGSATLVLGSFVLSSRCEPLVLKDAVSQRDHTQCVVLAVIAAKGVDDTEVI